MDGKTFEAIAKVKGKGNSNEVVDCIINDFYPFQGINYYRLKQVDVNGEHSYSRIISVNMDEGKLCNNYPNPASSLLTIEFKEASVTKVYIKDVLGRNLVEPKVSADANEINLDISHFSSGSYIVKLVSEEGKVLIEKFIKQ